MESDNVLLSMNQIMKELKRRENSLFNCLNSIHLDAKFIEEFARLYSSLPLVANLRCGLWYIPEPQHTCYFKSTDGHYGNWGFSTVRLNWHVALMAAKEGGLIIVDATRRGKTFPDALAKTIPIWAAVINSAVKQYRVGNRQDLNSWDTSLNLPLWLPETEKSQIEGRKEEWTNALLQSGANIGSLANILKKPLRCMWISQQGKLRQSKATDISSLSFTPIFLVSASVPNSRQRINVRASANSPAAREVFEYVPGAGDDEESWAQNLTPSLFWENRQALIDSGADGVENLVAKLIRESARGGQVKASQTILDENQGSSSTERDIHHPKVKACKNSIQSNSSDVTKPPKIGNTGLYLGNWEAGYPDQVFNTVDAVLNVGLSSTSKLLEDSRSLWVPIESVKTDRHALEIALPVALNFIAIQLMTQKKTLIHCGNGTDESVCVVLVALALFFKLDEGGVMSVDFEKIMAWIEKQSTRADDDIEETDSRNHSRFQAPVASQITKDDVRKLLVFVSSHYPKANPCRGNLRQVYNYLRTQ